MQPDPPQPGFPQNGQPPMPGGPAPWGGGPRPFARPNAAATLVAGYLSLLTAGLLVWFATYNVVYSGGAVGPSSGPVWENVVGGVIAAGLLLLAAVFTFARTMFGVWALYALCMFYVLAILVVQPLAGSTTFGAQFKWVFGFQKSNGIAMGMVIISCILTAITAAIAGLAKSYDSGGR